MSKEAMKLALEAIEMLVRFESDSWELGSCRIAGRAITALREELAEQPAQQEQGPVARTKAIAECLAVLRPAVKRKFPQEQALEELAGYTSPPAQRKPWVGLTEQEAAECWSTSTVRTWQAIEAKLKEKNA